MNKWIIPCNIIEQSRLRARNSFIGKEPEANSGYLTLYNKNSNKNILFLISSQQSPKYYAVIVEADSIPRYWQKMIRRLP